jgi:hypothetical protein
MLNPETFLGLIQAKTHISFYSCVIVASRKWCWLGVVRLCVVVVPIESRVNIIDLHTRKLDIDLRIYT